MPRSSIFVRHWCSRQLKREPSKHWGLLVKRKPNGRPLVARCEFDRVMSGQQPIQRTQDQSLGVATRTVDVIGLQAWARNRKGAKGGQQT